MKVEFNVKYGKNVIEIPITDKTKPAFTKSNMTDLWKAKVTIYNDVPKTAFEERRIDRHVIDLCQVQGGYVDKANGTVQNIVNAKSVITKDISRYKPPEEYYLLPAGERDNYFTVQVGDFVVLREVEDVITWQELSQLVNKYKNDGFRILSVQDNINGMSVDNITMANV